MKRTVKVSLHISEMIKMLYKAIKEKRLLYFYYESDTSGKVWREIRPYMITENGKDNLELVGLPTKQLKKATNNPDTIYLIN